MSSASTKVVIAKGSTGNRTTTAYLTYQFLNKLGNKTAYLGTIGFKLPDEEIGTENTTPDILSIYTLLLHAIEKECKTLECKALSKITINPEKCKGCGLCQRHCPVNAIEGEGRETRTINQEKCIKCGTCLTNCPFHAIGN